MVTFITIIHILVSIFLIVVVLMQSGEAGDIASAFGGMGSQATFGPRGGATVLTKATTWAAVIFVLTSITLSIVASRKAGPKSVLQGVSTQTAPAQKPAAPAPPAK